MERTLTEERRNEILRRLEEERKAKRAQSTRNDARAEERDALVRKLLAERAHTTAPPQLSATASAPGVRQTTREKEEKEEKEEEEKHVHFVEFLEEGGEEELPAMMMTMTQPWVSPSRPVGQERGSGGVSRHAREKIQEELEAEFEEEHPFQPQISARSKALVPESRESVLARLAMDKTKLYREREKLKLAREEEEAARVRREASSAAHNRRRRREKSVGKGRRGGRVGSMPVEDRLYAAGMEAAKARRKAAAAAGAPGKECTFTPATHKRRAKAKTEAKGNGVPLYKRVTQVQRSKNARLHKLRMDVLENDDNLTFAPKTNPRPRTGRNGGDAGQVFDRLSKAASVAEQKKKKLERDLEQERTEKYTFRPKISAKSKALVATSTLMSSEVGQDGGGKGMDAFLARQAMYDERARRAREEAQAAVEAEMAAAFKPEINESISRDPRRRRGSGEEDADGFLDRCARLAEQESTRSAKLRAKVEEEYYAQFTFQPKINPVSRSMAKNRTLAALTQEPGSGRQGGVETEAAALEFHKAHPFRPQLNPNSARATSYLRDKSNLMARIEADRAAKERALEEARRAQEAAVLEECSFAPERITALAEVPAPAKPVQVKGLDRFMELQRLRQAKEAEKKELERRAFTVSQAALVGKIPTRDRGDTPPKKRERPAKPRGRTAYVPHTNHRARSDLVQRILAEHSSSGGGGGGGEDPFYFEE